MRTFTRNIIASSSRRNAAKGLLQLALLCFFLCQTAFSQSWHTTDITNTASINFPTEPQRSVTGGGGLIFHVHDQYATYMVVTKRFTGDWKGKITEEDRNKLYDETVKTTLLVSKGRLNTTVRGLFNEVSYMDLEYRTPAKPNMPNRQFKRIVYHNQHMISIEFWPYSKDKDDHWIKAQKSHFFNSLTFKKTPFGDLLQGPSVDLDLGLDLGLLDDFPVVGKIVRRILLFLAVITVLVAIVVALRRILVKRPKLPAFSPPARSRPARGNPAPTALPHDIEYPVYPVICPHCDAENPSDANYCKGCGAEL